MSDLIGRRTEIEALERALTTAIGGRRGVVVLTGDAGIGKSAVLDHVGSLAEAHGAVRLALSTTAAESGIGWAALATALRRLPVAVVERRTSAQRQALRVAMGVDEPTGVEALAVAAAFSDVLLDLAEAAPLVVEIDDAHWLDEASAGALSFAIRATAGAPVLFLLGARPGQLAVDVGRLVDPADLTVVELGGLSLGGVHQLLVRHAGVELSRVDLHTLAEISGGNPLHVLQSGRLLADGAPLTEALAPRRLTDVLASRLAVLASSTRRVLEAAALATTDRLHPLDTMFPRAELLDALADAERADVIRVVGDSFHFHHPLLRSAVIDAMSADERRRLHRRHAELTDDPEVRAHHVGQAAQAPDETAAAVLDDAARSAARRGLPFQALRHAVRARDLTDTTDRAATSRRELDVAAAALDCGDARRGLESVGRAVALAPDADPTRALMLEVRCRAAAEGPPAAVADARRLVELLPERSRERLDALVVLARLEVYDDLGASARTARQAVDEALAGGDAAAILQATATLAVADTLRGAPVDVAALVDRLDQLGRVAGHTGPLSARAMIAEVCVWTDHLESGHRLLADDLAQAEADGSFTQHLNTLSQLGALEARRGRWDLADDLLEQCASIASTASRPEIAATQHIERARIAASRGHHATASAELERATSLGLEATPVETWFWLTAAGSTRLLAGDHRAAAALLAEARRVAERLGLLDPGTVPFWADLVDAELAAGRPEAADDALRRLTAADTARPRSRAEVARARALVEADRRELAAARDSAAEAVAALREIDAPFDLARALLLAGSLARRTNRRADARDLLDEARSISERIGAAPSAEQARRELDRLGIRAGDPAQLTATEAEIARLVATGRSNGEIATELFVSRRTVESNLTRVYRKLGVRTRAELAARLAADGR